MTDVRRFLPRTHTTFLGRFARPTEIQIRAIPPILEGRDVLLCSPTASGKTEAFAAPLVERLLGGERAPFSILVVSPTRALANDLKRRLEGRMEDLQVSFGRYTGEHKERRGGKLPEVAVTTPEAFDSLLARRPDSLHRVRAVVLDEIHILDGTARGDQLRFLLHRLDLLTGRAPQRLAASATVPSPEEFAKRYLREPVIAASGERRGIRARPFPGTSPAEVARHLDTLAEAGFRKVLVFCNRRKDVEALAGGIVGRTRFGEAVFPHHGSLARNLRERTERRFLESPAAVAFATLTLELGIDIGSVDYILLISPPSGVQSLLQRIGRGNRRTGDTRVGYAYATEGARRLFLTLLRHAGEGDLLAGPYALRPGVLVQQALILAGAHGYVTAAALKRVVPPALLPSLPGDAARSVLGSMMDGGLLEPPVGGRYVLTEKYEWSYDRGVLHSNFLATTGSEVVDRLTGEVIAHLGEVDPPDRVKLGGRGRAIVRRERGRILTDSSPVGEKPEFGAHGKPVMSFPLARAFARDLGCGEGELLQRRRGDAWILVHGLGSAGGALLVHLLGETVGRTALGRPGPMTLELAERLEALPVPGPREIPSLVARHERAFTAAANMGRFHWRLPPAIRRRAVREAADLEGIARFLGRATLVTQEHPEAPGFWQDL